MKPPWKLWILSGAAILGSSVALGEELPQQVSLPQPAAEVEPAIRLGALTRALAPAHFVPLVAGPNWTALGPAPIPNGQTQGFCSGGPRAGMSCNTNAVCGTGGICSPSNSVSGRVTAIAVHPTDPNKIYVGTAQGGVYRSLDGGMSWTAISDGALSLAIGAVAIAPSNPTTVFVGTGEANFSQDSYSGVGIYRIDDAETTATLSGPFNRDTVDEDVFTGASISRVLIDPSDVNNVFVSTVFGHGGIGGSFPARIPRRGIYRSTNALSANPTFARLNVPTAIGSAGDVTDMVLEPGNPNNLGCAVLGTGTVGDGGLWRSTDALDVSPTFIQTESIGPTCHGGTNDGGPCGSPADCSGGTCQFTNMKLAINAVGGAVTVLAATGLPSGIICPDAEGDGGVLIESLDGGATWPAALVGGFCDKQCSYDIAPAIDPTSTNNIYLGGAAHGMCSGILIRSTDGSAFTDSDTGLHADTHVVAVAPSNPLIVYTGNDGGIFRSVDAGATWASINGAGFSATQFESLALHPTDRNFMIGGTQDNGTQLMRPNGTWTRADFGDGGYALIDQNAADTVNVTMYHTYFNRSGQLIGFARVTTTNDASDGRWALLGASGNPCSSNNGINCNDRVLFYAPMALGPGNPNSLYFGTDRLYRSSDRGSTMTVVSQAPFVSGVAVSAIGISAQDDTVRIVGLANGRVFATTMGANPLTEVSGPIPASYVARAIIDPNNSNTAYVALAGFGLAAGEHIWKTTNLMGGGATWTAAGNGIPDVPVNALVVDSNDSNQVYAGTDIGVFRSADGGATWNLFGAGMPRVAVFDIAIQNANRILRAATHGRGIYELELGASATTTTTTVAPPTTTATTSSTTTTLQPGCPREFPVDCGNGSCCPSGDVCDLMFGGCCAADHPVGCANACCPVGSQCGPNDTCVAPPECSPDFPLDCGNGTCCAAGDVCDLRSGGCCAADHPVGCRNGCCPAGTNCAPGDTCAHGCDVDCGDGECCPAGSHCESFGCESDRVARRECGAPNGCGPRIAACRAACTGGPVRRQKCRKRCRRSTVRRCRATAMCG